VAWAEWITKPKQQQELQQPGQKWPGCFVSTSYCQRLNEAALAVNSERWLMFTKIRLRRRCNGGSICGRIGSGDNSVASEQPRQDCSAPSHERTDTILGGTAFYPGSTRCQRVHLGSLPRCFTDFAQEMSAEMLPASCRQLQAGSLRSPEVRLPDSQGSDSFACRI
jgi:hypothetical protein